MHTEAALFNQLRRFVISVKTTAIEVSWEVTLPGPAESIVEPGRRLELDRSF